MWGKSKWVTGVGKIASATRRWFAWLPRGFLWHFTVWHGWETLKMVWHRVERNLASPSPFFVVIFQLFYHINMYLKRERRFSHVHKHFNRCPLELRRRKTKKERMLVIINFFSVDVGKRERRGRRFFGRNLCVSVGWHHAERDSHAIRWDC